MSEKIESHHRKERKDQEIDNPNPPLAASAASGLTSAKDEPEPPLIQILKRPKSFDDGHN